MLVVRGAVKNYDWGITDGLAPWAGEHPGGTQAELWFGVHPGGPSPLVDAEGDETGEVLADRFDIAAIPLLVKLLAAARPLSVQVHPQLSVAAAGWAAQQTPGAPLVLSDPFEKTEMLVALGPFEAFAGWRDREQVLSMLAALGGAQEAARRLVADDLGGAVGALLAIGTNERIALLAVAASTAGLAPDQIAAYRTVAENYPDDQGALVTVLLDYVSLCAGEAIYVPAGVPHSYIRGIGLEVMTSSDNVIRLGLTRKPVFADRAIAALRPDLDPQIVRAVHGDILWPVNSPFVVRMLTEGEERIPMGAYRILLLIKGTARVVSDAAEISLRRGTAAVMAANDPDAYVEADGLVAIIQSTER
ncbi:MAG: mannose-6-phosphate isomerase, class I [Actinomycetota bacterium]|nr:mannose-6-phosphate isomerase, class I [Actinomycetota bacterium]